MDESKRVVVITGGSKGIGRSVALKFAEENAIIIIVHYDPDDSAANETINTLKEKHVETESHKIDVSSFEDVGTLFQDIISRFGKVDVLVNNAGITSDNLLLRMRENDWDKVINVNLKSVFNCSKAVIKFMIKQRSGSIINISSVVGQTGNPGQANYSASKAGIMGLTKSIAREVASRKVNVNAVAPGFINTEMTASLPEKTKEEFIRQIPMNRLGESEDVAEAVYWLASSKASYITGQVIHVNGGLYM